MQNLLKMLEAIYKLLEQVSTITTNQTTILIQSREDTEKANEALDMLESMVDYKEELITQISEREQAFDKSYEPFKGKINDPKYIKLFKSWVEQIMEMKKSIVEAERNNVCIMQSFTSMKEKQIIIPKAPNAITAAYKKQQTQS